MCKVLAMVVDTTHVGGMGKLLYRTGGAILVIKSLVG